ncbi:THUMP domain-containing protein 3 [Biomphalaria pfeifferi]|uniref:THUMP domain-containing protein 3 n=1 Tax=Biomphalaria pfeifferi TaxID=112525 RepID=A0AAD8B903_BIOPF|nr:THUMP domain-containing protein 3 [Biomphalaria pfeifferi]
MASSLVDYDTGNGMSSHVDKHEEKLYTIEASVVTGFEETARGEAKELFNTEVKAARGKIKWAIPYNRIQDVLKMGSIDNFKVVMHCVPHFHFTDQHDSLSRLQKMVADVDWENGLSVWRLFNNFSHPIPPHPEVIPTPDDLVQVIIMGNLPAKKGKEEKKYKKGGNWKKKKDKKLTKEIQSERNRDNDKTSNKIRCNTKTTLSSYKHQSECDTSTNIQNDQALNETEVSRLEIRSSENRDVQNNDGKPLDKIESKFTPACETELQNVEATPFDKTELQNAGATPFDKTELQNAEATPVDKTELQNVEATTVNKTELQNVEATPVDKTELQNVEATPVGKTELQNDEANPISKTELQNIEATLIDTTELHNLEVKSLIEKKSQILEVQGLCNIKVGNVVKPVIESVPSPGEWSNVKSKFEVQNVDVKLFCESQVRSVEDKFLDEPKVQTKDIYPPKTQVINDDIKCPDESKICVPNVMNIVEPEVKKSDKKTMTVLHEPKTVIIKRREDWNKDTQIDIKVLLPNPDENMFPAKLTESDDRNVEPMDVDISLSNASIREEALNFAKDISVMKPRGDNEISVNRALSEECLSSLSETEFASSVIKKLTSQPSEQLRTFEGSNSPQSTSTPPPTPTFFATSLADLSSSKDTILDSMQTGNKCAADVASSKDSTVLDSPATKNKLDTDSAYEARSDYDLDTLYDSSLLKSSPTKTGAVPVMSVEAASRDPTKPTFRVTCNRNGESHPFDSPSAAASFGSAVNKYHQWIVDLSNYDIEVVLDIDHDEVSVCLGLTKTSLHKRNMVAFGPTTLRATICYNMLRLCRIKTGDIICDPMCGSGALPIEGAMSWVHCYHLGGDNHGRAIERTCQNVSALQDKIKLEQKNGLKLDVVQWSIEHLPLRDQSVDVFISDLPFGHRLGNRASNRTLYPNLLTEMARTATTGARACLLTEDKANFIKAVNNLSKFWQRRLMLNINIGGLSGVVFVLTRTATAIRSHLTSWNEAAANINQETTLGSGDSGQLPPDNSTDIHVLESVSVKNTESSPDCDKPVLRDENLFC